MKPKLSEWHIYGNEQQGRFVTRKPESTLYYLENISNDVLAKNFYRTMDKKQYELKDHLGNVRATIGDYKMPFNDATSTRGVTPFFVDEKATNDYYPYGMLISDRSFNSGKSRYGYNGKENDNEVKGVGNSVDYGERMSDVRLGGRFFSTDAFQATSPWESPYANAGNNPILNIDDNGNFKLSASLKKYPTLKKAVTVGLKQFIKNNPNIFTLLKKYGHVETLSNDEAKKRFEMDLFSEGDNYTPIVEAGVPFLDGWGSTNGNVITMSFEKLGQAMNNELSQKNYKDLLLHYNDIPPF
ncbi:MAG: hypothetical protein NTW25_00830 [Candidatus Kapabacteria bacterium]|nr:hypothetical protein [Candidatus Kapabacteria bacterium]